MRFLSELNRAQQYIQYLIESAEMEELDGFNGYIGSTVDKWMQLDLPGAILSRIAEICPLEVEKKQLKHSWWRLFSFGSYMSEEMIKDDLRDQLRTIRGQLASIEFLYKETY